MNGKIKIWNEVQGCCTAKGAMQQVVTYMNAKNAYAIGVFTMEDTKEIDAESELFVKMSMRFLHKNSKKVFLLAQNEDMLLELGDYVEETYPKIRVMEMANWEENAMSYDMILNRINGAEAECIIAAIPAEEQETFISQYRTALDAKIWLGVGTNLKKKKSKFIPCKINKFISGIFGKKDKKAN